MLDEIDLVCNDDAKEDDGDDSGNVARFMVRKVMVAAIPILDLQYQVPGRVPVCVCLVLSNASGTPPVLDENRRTHTSTRTRDDCFAVGDAFMAHALGATV